MSKIIIDMVHNNPGEPDFDTEFSSPSKLSAFGYTGQVLRRPVNVVSLEGFSGGVFPADQNQRDWLDGCREKLSNDLESAKAESLLFFCHIDLFLLPKPVVEKFQNDICDENTGKISIEKQATKQLYQSYFDEFLSLYPKLDGFVVRVGENYPYDTPYHIGNCPIDWAEHDEKLSREKQQYVSLLNFLVAQICKRHKKYLIFRTWDCNLDRFHSSLEYYLDVSNKVVQHKKLFFSIKHTTIDFFRYIKLNPCLGKGLHNQIIEVQCQREYEGKGAYPNYIAKGAVEGFEETGEKTGIKDVIDSPVIKGVFTWSRGGGWFGPYLKNELWPDLNAYVISGYFANPKKSEEQIFNNYWRDERGLSKKDCKLLRNICLNSAEAVLKGLYCAEYDKTYQGLVYPCGLWIRDDRICGLGNLAEVFEYLYAEDAFDRCLAEKKTALGIWGRICADAEKLETDDIKLKDFIIVSSRYGKYLYEAIFHAWRVLTAGFKGDKNGTYDLAEIASALKDYDKAWRKYSKLPDESQQCPSLFIADYYWAMPGSEPASGLNDSIDHYRELSGDTTF